MITKAILLLMVPCSLATLQGQSFCCGGENVLEGDNSCSDGGQIKAMDCEHKFVLEKDEVTINETGYLFFSEDDAMPPDKYCTTTMKAKEIHIVCYDEMENDPYNEMMTLTMHINVGLSLISVFFIILTIAVYLSLPQLLDHEGICLIWSISGLAFSYIALAVIDLSNQLPEHFCQLLAFCMYTAFMFSFCWLNVLCFHIWKMIVNPSILRFTKRWLLIYHIFGIGVPIILLFILLIASHSGLEYFHDIHPGIGEAKCWFISTWVALIYFYGPVSVLLCINIVYFVWTTKVLWSQMKNCSEKQTKVLKYRLLLCVKLFFVMGLPWCFEVISALLENTTPKWVWVIPDACNALQGLLIFLLLVVFRKRVIRGLANKKIFRSLRLPVSWRHAQDDECEELEEEMSLSGVDEKKPGIFH